jgi:hypothetical protein
MYRKHARSARRQKLKKVERFRAELYPQPFAERQREFLLQAGVQIHGMIAIWSSPTL